MADINFGSLISSLSFSLLTWMYRTALKISDYTDLFTPSSQLPMLPLGIASMYKTRVQYVPVSASLLQVVVYKLSLVDFDAISWQKFDAD
jgi:hypothetical protein